MNCVITKNIISDAKGGNHYTYNLLFPFCSDDNPHKVAINKDILSIYSVDCTEILRTWLDGLAKSNNFKITEPTETGSCIFLSTALNTYEKVLIVHEKEEYSSDDTTNINQYLDKDEAILHLFNSTQTTIIQSGDGNQAALGDNSPTTITG